MKNSEHDDSGQSLADLRATLARAVSQLDLLERRAGRRPVSGDQLQVDVGGYVIHQGDPSGRIIAELYVEVDPNDPFNDNSRIEHWGLYPDLGWTTPSRTNMQPAPWAFDFNKTASYGTAQEFRDYLRTSKPNAIYIQARCLTQRP